MNPLDDAPENVYPHVYRRCLIGIIELVSVVAISLFMLYFDGESRIGNGLTLIWHIFQILMAGVSLNNILSVLALNLARRLSPAGRFWFKEGPVNKIIIFLLAGEMCVLIGLGIPWIPRTIVAFVFMILFITIQHMRSFVLHSFWDGYGYDMRV